MPTETDLPNGGKRTTFIATSEVNGTNIVCAARMGIMINTTEVVYLYIQGIMIIYFNTSTKLQHLTLMCCLWCSRGDKTLIKLVPYSQN